LVSSPHISTDTIAGADHNFTGESRRTLLALINERLSERH
jgi:hypothetical protein